MNQKKKADNEIVFKNINSDFKNKIITITENNNFKNKN
jgi:hypothetical protein